MEEEKRKCSFCFRPERLVLKLIIGPKGKHICDLCVLEAESRKGKEQESLWEAECSLCGKTGPELRILLSSQEASICDECASQCRKILDEELGDKERDFLKEAPVVDLNDKLKELLELATSFANDFQALHKSFEKAEIDWGAHNNMAQKIRPMKSKARVLGKDALSDLLWEIENLFQSIRFDDVELNRESVENLKEMIDRLTEMIG